MSKQAKAMQRLIRNREGNEAYDSDEEKNPYASSVSGNSMAFFFCFLCAKKQKESRKGENKRVFFFAFSVLTRGRRRKRRKRRLLQLHPLRNHRPRSRLRSQIPEQVHKHQSLPLLPVPQANQERHHLYPHLPLVDILWLRSAPLAKRFPNRISAAVTALPVAGQLAPPLKHRALLLPVKPLTAKS